MNKMLDATSVFPHLGNVTGLNSLYSQWRKIML